MDTDWTQADADAALARLRAVVERLPEAEVQPTSGYGHTGFAVRGSRFAWLTVDHHDDGRLAVWVKATLPEQAALVAAEPRRYFVPPYSGPAGWVGVLLDPAADPDWDQVVELLEAAWRSKAPKRAVRAWEATSGRPRFVDVDSAEPPFPTRRPADGLSDPGLPPPRSPRRPPPGRGSARRG